MSNSEWGAIRRSLADSVSNVIEKKMGTSSGYKPSEWRDIINLMGKLPEKTASGAIASFADGADGVPVKSCSVSFLPSGGGGTPSSPVAITGVSGLSVTQLGANFWNEDWEVGGINDTTGLPNSETNKIRSKTFFGIKGGATYYVVAPQNIRVLFYSENETFISETANIKNNTFTVPSNASKAKIRGTVDYGTTYNNDISINYPATATTYSAYVTPSVVTDTFGQTIYGGTRDLTTDKASVTWLAVPISDLTFVKESTCQHTFRCGTLDRKYGSGNYNLISASFVTYTQGHSSGSNISTLEVGNDFTIFCNSGSKTFYISTDSSYDSKTASQFTTDFGSVLLIFELATPTEITGLTPHAIDTLYGDNNFFADTGTTTVEYRADIDLALNA